MSWRTRSRGGRLGALVIGAGLVVAGLPGPADTPARAADPPPWTGMWSDAGVLSDPSTGHALAPLVGADADGDAFATWVHVGNGTGSAVRGGTWNETDTGWIAPEEVGGRNTYDSRPALAVSSSGHVVSVWTGTWQGEWLNTLRRWQTTLPYGPTWEDILDIEDYTRKEAPSVAVNTDGETQVIYSQIHKYSSTVRRTAIYAAHGRVDAHDMPWWNLPVKVAEEPSGVHETVVQLTDDGTALAAWIDGERQVHLAKSTNAGVSWGTRVLDIGDGVTASALDFAVSPNGTEGALVFEARTASGAPWIEMVRVDDGAWTAARRLSPIGDPAREPAVAVGPLGPVVSYTRYDNQEWYIAVTRWDSGVKETENVSPRDSSQSDIGVDGSGTIHVLFATTISGRRGIMSNEHTPTGWRDQLYVSSPLTENRLPQLSVSANGEAFAVWIETPASGQPRVAWSHFDPRAAPPELPSFKPIVSVTPSSAPVGSHITLRVEVTPTRLAANRTVRIQFRPGTSGTWTLLAKKQLNANGVYEGWVYGSMAGTVQFRALISGIEGLIKGGVSPTVSARFYT